MKLRQLVEDGMDFAVAFRALIPEFAANMGMPPGTTLTDIAERKGVQQTGLSGFTNGSYNGAGSRLAEVVAEVSGEDLEWVKQQGARKREAYKLSKETEKSLI